MEDACAASRFNGFSTSSATPRALEPNAFLKLPPNDLPIFEPLPNAWEKRLEPDLPAPRISLSTALRKPFIEGNIDTWPVPTSDPKAIRRLPS